jgi:hypothetical protein
MKIGSMVSLSFLLALGTLTSPKFARARGVDPTQPAHPSSSLMQAKQEAALMVPAAAELKTGIDARKVHPGDPIEAVLQDTVHLKNGPELKGGTILMGKVTADRMQSGNARLALRFTGAKLKGGQILPIKATILLIGPPTYNYMSEQRLVDEADLWHGRTLQVDQVGALRNIDMHSKIASMNSAVFVSHKNDNMKLAPSSQLVVAIAERS